MLIAPFEAPTHCWTSHCHRPPLQSLLWVTDSVGSWCAGLFSLFHHCWECSIEFPAEIPCYGVPSSISMGLLQVCGWITPPPVVAGEVLECPQHIRHIPWSCSGIHNSSTGLRQPEMSPEAHHTLSGLHLALCSRVTLSPVHHRGGEGWDPPAQQRWGRTTSRPSNGGGLFLSPLSWLPNTPMSSTQGVLCSAGFIPGDRVEGWKKASGSAVVLTDDICSEVSVSSIHP